MEKNPGQAINYLLGEAKQQGFPGIIFTDPYHPGFCQYQAGNGRCY